MLIQTNIYENIDRSIQKILDVYHKTAESLNLRQTYKKLCNNNQLWWDSACDRSKQYKYKMLRNFRSSGSGRDLALYITAKRNFKKICTNKKIDYQKCMRNKLIQERKNPNSFWKMLRCVTTKYRMTSMNYK